MDFLREGMSLEEWKRRGNSEVSKGDPSSSTPEPQSLDWSDLDSLFCQIADIINNRPLGVFHGDDDYHQICPNDLLLGRTHHTTAEPHPMEEGDLDPKTILTE